MARIQEILHELFGSDDDETDANVPLPTCDEPVARTCVGVGASTEGEASRAGGRGVLLDLDASRTHLLPLAHTVVRPLPGLIIVHGALTPQQQLDLAAGILDSGCLVGETSEPHPPDQAQQQRRAGLSAGVEARTADAQGASCSGCGAGGSGQLNRQLAPATSCSRSAGNIGEGGGCEGGGVDGGSGGNGRRAPNQAMFFGPLPQWGRAIGPLLPLDQLLPPHLSGRVPSFDQAIVNLYRPGEGIVDHVDLARFQDGIVGVSCGGPVVMDFRRLPGRRARPAGGAAGGGGGDGEGGAAAEAEAVAEAGYSREAVERLLQSEGGDDDDARAEGEDDVSGMLPESRPGDGVWWFEDEEAAAAAEATRVAAGTGTLEQAAAVTAGPGPHSNGPPDGARKRRRRRHLRVLLQGGDLIGLSGEARLGWTHGIAQGVTQERVLLPARSAPAASAAAPLGGEQGHDQGSGPAVVGLLGQVPRGVRLSVTLRRLVPDIVLCEEAGREQEAGSVA
ncbi:hypothetical protein HXX76_016156 [Chlamydomonas incerta]|uniref:Fe2OG dioxygenase domain-containing protein n=1 Tax=Chlamydomonas incerta TaxID=51695 RepID=A0A835VQZ0_CHLIN|nr:hypothetical protein HXX76_016156 [Chlamydomonas incerta]|eukprot:KAG2422279.1 hypothetical protein HXX76_016156 [Chlamydomonas incerta]